MLNLLLGLGLAGYGAYSIYTYTGDLTPLFYLKFGGVTLTGLGVSIWNAIPLLKNIKFPELPKVKNTGVNAKVEDKMAKELSEDIKVEDVQEQDMVALFYLTERLKGLPEGADLCRKLNDLIFTLHHPVKGA